MKQNVRMLRYRLSTTGRWHTSIDQTILTYEHPEYLEEGTLVRVDCGGYAYEGQITYQGHAWDGQCKPILEVLTRPAPFVVV